MENCARQHCRLTRQLRTGGKGQGLANKQTAGWQAEEAAQEGAEHKGAHGIEVRHCPEKNNSTWNCERNFLPQHPHRGQEASTNSRSTGLRLKRMRTGVRHREALRSGGPAILSKQLLSWGVSDFPLLGRKLTASLQVPEVAGSSWSAAAWPELEHQCLLCGSPVGETKQQGGLRRQLSPALSETLSGRYKCRDTKQTRMWKLLGGTQEMPFRCTAPCSRDLLRECVCSTLNILMGLLLLQEKELRGASMVPNLQNCTAVHLPAMARPQGGPHESRTLCSQADGCRPRASKVSEPETFYPVKVEDV